MHLLVLLGPWVRGCVLARNERGPHRVVRTTR